MASVTPREAYTAPRAAALAGVPVRTVYHWAKVGLYGPSVSPVKVRLYSLPDVVALRAIYWLRSPKGLDDEGEYTVPPTKMREVRRAIAEVMAESPDLDLFSLNVDPAGKVFLDRRRSLETTTRQGAARPMMTDVLRAFRSEANIVGPDLGTPRPLLRIISGKLGGEPHVHETRLRTLDIDALHLAGYPSDQIVELYPFLRPDQVAQSLDLEAQLKTNLKAA
jgi:uncharacterized protein (DUF433 family)